MGLIGRMAEIFKVSEKGLLKGGMVFQEKGDGCNPLSSVKDTQPHTPTKPFTLQPYNHIAFNSLYSHYTLYSH